MKIRVYKDNEIKIVEVENDAQLFVLTTRFKRWEYV